jgi:TP901 family phage tail tape measure protein
MSLSARELFLIVRAQNQASSTLRRIGTDVAGLGRKEQLRFSQQQLGIQRMRAENTLTNAQSKLRALNAQSGLRDEKSRLSLADRANTLARGVQGTVRDNILAEDKMNRLQQRRSSILQAQSSMYRNISTLRKSGLSPSDIAAEEKPFQKSLSALNNQLGSVDKQISAHRHTITMLGQSLGGLINKYGMLSNSEKAAAESSAAHAEKIAATQRQVGIASANVQQLTEKQRALDQEVHNFRVERLGQGVHLLGSMGRQLQLIGGAGAAALGFAANSAAQLSTQATLAATQSANTVSQVGAESQKNMDAILAQMRQFPAASSDMASALYDIFSTLNVNGPQGRAILEQLNKAAVGGAISVQAAGQGVLSVLSNFKEIPQTAAGVATALNRSFAAVRFGRMTMAEFQKSLQTTAPAARQTGQTFDNLSGSVAFLSRSLGSSKASVGYARLLQQLSSTTMVAGLKAHGIAVRDASGNYRQLDQIMGDINRKFPQLAKGQESAQNFFKALSGATGTIQASRAFTAIITNIGGYNDILRKTTGDNNEFKKSFDAMNESAGVKWARALNVLKSLWIELGRAALGTISELLGPIGTFANMLTKMDQSTKNAIGRAIALAVAIAGVTGVVLTAASAIGGFGLILDGIGAVASLGVIAAITGIALAVMLVIRNWSQIKPVLIKYWPDVRNAVVAAVGGVTNVLQKLSGTVESMVGLVVALLQGNWSQAWTQASDLVGHFGDVITIALRGAFDIVGAYLKAMTTNISTFVAGLIGIALIGVRVASALKAIAAGYQAIAVAQAAAAATGEATAVSGKGGLFFGLGQLASSVVGKLGSLKTDVLLVADSFSAAGGGVAGFAAALADAGALLGPVGIVVGIVAAGAAVYALGRAFGWWGGQANRVQQDIDALKKSLDAMGKAGVNVAGDRNTLQGQTLAIEQVRKSMVGLKRGSVEYQQQEQSLQSLQLQRIQTLKDLKAAQDALNASMSDSTKHLDDLVNQNAFAQPPGGLSVSDLQARIAAGQSALVQSPGVVNQTKAFQAQLQTFRDTEGVLSTSITKYKELIAEGISPTDAHMKALRQSIMDANKQLVSSDPAMATRNYQRMSTFIISMTKALGVSPSRGLQQYLAQLPPSIQKAETAYSRLTGHVLSDPLAHIIFDNKKVDTALAAFFATTKDKLGSRKFTVDLGKIIQLGQGRDAGAALNKWLTNFITRFHHLPSQKQVNIEIGVIDKATAKAREIAHRVAQQARSVQNLSHLNFQTGGGASSALDAAQAKLDKMKNKNIKVNASMNWSPNDPWAKFTQGASKVAPTVHAARETLVGGMTAAGTDAATGFKNAFDAGAAALKASGQLTVTVVRQAIGAKSPSTEFAKVGVDASKGFKQGFDKDMKASQNEIRKLIMQGTDLSGMKPKDKAKAISDAYKTAATTATQFMQSAFTTIHDEAVQNFGSLFQGTDLQTKIDWGAKLNITDLTSDLQKQDTTFRTFNHNLNTLTRHHAPKGLIDQLRALGPSANTELEALNGATKKQLKTYFKLFDTSQRDINKATNTAFNSQRKQWLSHGRSMAVGIMLGLKSEQPALTRYFSRIWDNLIHVARTKNKSHSPSMLYAQEGINIVQGLRLGMERAAHGLSVPMPGFPGYGPLLSGKHRGMGGDTIIYQTVNAHHSESLMTTLAKSNFRLKHRR